MRYGVYALALGLMACVVSARQHELAIIIPSYNNAQWYEKNLKSVFDQTAQNYNIFYIDDASIDGTADLVQNYVAQCGKQEYFTLIRNDHNQGALANIYRVVRSLPDDTIVVTLDGDDWLAVNQVFARINACYDTSQVWMTYGQYQTYPRNTVGHCRAMPEGIMRKNAYREYDWITSHLRTFYAGLFKKIQLKDLLDEKGQFFSVTWDMAFMFPMLEMAGSHVHFIPEVQYIYNQDTPINDFKIKCIEQIHCDRLIRSRAKYELITHPYTDHKKQSSVCVVIIGSTPQELEELKQKAAACMHGITAVHTIDAASPHFANEIRSLIDTTLCTHILFIDEGTQLQEVDLIQCAQELERTGAHAVYLDMPYIGVLCANSVYKPVGQMLNDNFVAWQFKHGAFEWRMPYYLHGALYRSSDISALLDMFKPMAARVMIWFANQTYFDMEKLGLFYKGRA